MFTWSFWKATAERVVATFAAALLSVIGVGAGVLDIRQIQWGQAFGIAGGAAFLTLLKCLVAGTGAIGPKGSPGLVADPAAANVTPPVLLAADERLGFNAGLLPPSSTRTTGSPWKGTAPPPRLKFQPRSSAARPCCVQGRAVFVVRRWGQGRSSRSPGGMRSCPVQVSWKNPSRSIRSIRSHFPSVRHGRTVTRWVAGISVTTLSPTRRP